MKPTNEVEIALFFRLPASPLEETVRDCADIVIFHVDGSASILDVRDGSKGLDHVVAGIGKVALGAAQLAMTKGVPTKVRKWLMWSSTGDPAVDGAITSSCVQSGTVPLIVGAAKLIAAVELARYGFITGMVRALGAAKAEKPTLEERCNGE